MKLITSHIPQPANAPASAELACEVWQDLGNSSAGSPIAAARSNQDDFARIGDERTNSRTFANDQFANDLFATIREVTLD